MSTTYSKNSFNIKINQKIKNLKINKENRLGSFYFCIFLLIADIAKWPVL